MTPQTTPVSGATRPAPRRVGLLVGLAGLAAVGACGGGRQPSSSSTIGESSSSVKSATAASATGADGGTYGSVHAGICTADADAAKGDVAAAKTAFEDAHQGLHEIADTAANTDRAASARLLEAKEKVEADLASSATPSAQLHADLDRLLPALRAGAAAAGSPTSATCG